MKTEKEVPMGLLDNVERGIEKAVRGAFSGRGGSLGPVEIATAVRRHMDRESFTMSQGRSFVPNVYRIRLSEEDFAAARKYGVALAEELCEEIIRHADSQGYTLLGPVKATFVKNTDLKRGQLGIESLTEKDAAGAEPAPSVHQPAPEAEEIAPTIAQPAVPTPSVVAVLDHEGRQHPVRAEGTVIGRSTSADLTIPDTGVSRRHLEVFRDGRRWIARDLGSTNGSYVDGEQLIGSHDQVELFDGALISLGNARLRFRLATGEV
ncbi:FhaA domain-containing protein [Nesterenkonia xinjiangensis]|uniref:FHA domain-containing protein n=1 Tax=Nesterenkonia xinjiangensis TaxID=225327 RepID=A0A7Z0GL67_9MICC|nr:DUF3662 and FHA domain-containing protein [Nesterenkonia xinjiangensis]NYJ78044.1 hypothetical protein [Nesterenkonia xinjiangensis]